MHFCLTGQYTPQALNSMMDNPTTNRYEAAKKLIEAAGGKLISMYSTPADGPGVMVIFDVPDPRCSTGDLWRCRSIRCPPQRKAHPSLDAGRSDARSAKGKSASWRIQAAQQVNALVAADSAATNLRYSRQLPPYAAPLPRRVNRYQPTPPQRRPLSVLSPIADKRGRGWLVRFVPILLQK